MSFLLTRDATYDLVNLTYVLTPAQPDKTGSMIATGIAPCMSYKSYYDVLLDTPQGTGTGQMRLFFCQMDAEASVEVGIHHNATSKSMTLSLSKTVDEGESYSQSVKYVDNVDVTALITYGQTFNIAINHFYGNYEAFINGQLILKGSSDVVYGLETGHFEVLATTSNVYGKQTLINYGVDPIFTVAQDLDVFGTVNASSYNIALCEEDLRVQVTVGSIVAHIGNEYITDPTFDNIMGQTVNRADYIELANSLGIPKSQTTFVVPALTTDWENVVNKPTNFQADWSTTVINKPTNFQADWNTTVINKPSLFSGSYTDLTNTPTIPAAQVNSDWNATSGVAQILNKPVIPTSQVNADWNATSGVAQILNKPAVVDKVAKLFSVVIVSSWVLRTTPADLSWYSVCWSPQLSLFVSVAFSGTTTSCVMTSPNGINWTQRATPTANNWNSVCWSPERSLFVAVAQGGVGNRVMTSPDGITWTMRSSAADLLWTSICWSPERSLFVAVATNGPGNRVMTSPDGITWTARASAADYDWYAVCWSPQRSLFVAVAGSGAGNRVMTSSDGVTWTLRTTPVNHSWGSICWSPELSLFVSVSLSTSAGPGNRVMTSPDGITWTARATPLDVPWTSICWSPQLSLFVAISNNSSANNLMTSPDGLTWTARASTATIGWDNILWSPELSMFVVTGSFLTGTRVMTTNSGFPPL